MKIVPDVAQGSQDWKALRLPRFNASEAPALMGASPHMSRAELLRVKATGDEKAFSEWEERYLLEKGRTAEQAGRARAEAVLGEDLYPVFCVSDEGRFAASPDGLTLEGDVGLEVKLMNESLRRQIEAERLEDAYAWQLDHQLMVTDAQFVLFVASDESGSDVAFLQYNRDPERIARLRAAWDQFEADLAAYDGASRPVDAMPIAAAPEALPALVLQIVGTVTRTNLEDWHAQVSTRIASIGTNLQTDDDFALAEKTIRFLADAEKELDAVKRQALAQTADIERVFNRIGSLQEQMRAKRLTLDKHVKTRKEGIRDEILAAGQRAFADHIRALNTRLGMPYMPDVPVNFAGAMHGRKTVKTLTDAVDAELQRAKLAANEVADRLQINLAEIDRLTEGCGFLFPDKRAIVQKPLEDMVATVKARIAEHKAEQERKRAAQQGLPLGAAADAAPVVKPVEGAVAPVLMTGDQARIALLEIIIAALRLMTIDDLRRVDALCREINPIPF